MTALMRYEKRTDFYTIPNGFSRQIGYGPLVVVTNKCGDVMHRAVVEGEPPHYMRLGVYETFYKCPWFEF